MIGSCTFLSGDVEVSATLHEGGTWAVVPDLEEPTAGILREILGRLTEDYRGPSAGPFGPGQLAELARRLRGTYTLEPKGSMPPGTVY